MLRANRTRLIKADGKSIHLTGGAFVPVAHGDVVCLGLGAEYEEADERLPMYRVELASIPRSELVAKRRQEKKRLSRSKGKRKRAKVGASGGDLSFSVLFSVLFSFSFSFPC